MVFDDDTKRHGESFLGATAANRPITSYYVETVAPSNTPDCTPESEGITEDKASQAIDVLLNDDLRLDQP